MSELGKIALDSLVGGPFRTKRVNIMSGQGVLKKGTILGRVKYTVPTTGTLAGTGNGTCTLVEPRKNIIPGTYTIDQATVLTLTSQAAAGVVTFYVTNPNGKLLGSFTIGLATSDVVDFDSDEISFRITNGSTDFAADSVFTIAVTEGVPNTGSAGSNTGDGLCQIVRGGPDVMVGTYTATCTEAITNGGKFQVTNPDGNVIGEFYVRNFTGTGNGTITQIIPGKNKKAGRYSVKCTSAVTNGGVFTVKDPDDVLVGTITLTVDAGHGTTPTYFYSDDISFKMTVGATDYLANDEFKIDVLNSTELVMEITDDTDFIVGDSFTVAVTIGADDCKRHNYANVDGTQEPYAVLYEDVDATSADVAASAIIGGQVVERELVIATPDFDAVPRLRSDLRAIGIEVVGSVARNPV
jgi:hypothetical protein